MMKIPLSGCRIDLAKYLFATTCCFLVVTSAWAAAPVNQLVVYPASEGIPQNPDFSVKVRTPGQKWHDVPTYVVKVAQAVATRPPATPYPQGNSQRTSRPSL